NCNTKEGAMDRVLALQSLPEAYFGEGDEMDSNLSNICSSETTACSTQSSGCKTVIKMDW
ncbi:MAG TPA: hypothetical protein VFD48_14280, partial [Pyrinomonadaceae bacterium]|nr:hypothetical protein [Pyrinomonadaceae bacterium]